MWVPAGDYRYLRSREGDAEIKKCHEPQYLVGQRYTLISYLVFFCVCLCVIVRRATPAPYSLHYPLATLSPLAHAVGSLLPLGNAVLYYPVIYYPLQVHYFFAKVVY